MASVDGIKETAVTPALAAVTAISLASIILGGISKNLLIWVINLNILFNCLVNLFFCSIALFNSSILGGQSFGMLSIFFKNA